MPDVHTTVNTPVTFPIAVEQGDAGVALTYCRVRGFQYD